jgi:hypothetical protein
MRTDSPELVSALKEMNVRPDMKKPEGKKKLTRR